MKFKDYKFDLQELGGGFGDIGVMIPLVVALIVLNGMNPVPVFLVFGLLYLFAGLYYKVPIPVQPMKAIAVVAIASSAGPKVIAASAILISLILLFIALSGFANSIAALFSKGLVRGVQLAIGLLLMRDGFQLIMRKSYLLEGEPLSISLPGLSIPVGIVGAVICALIILGLLKNKNFPASLVIVTLGIASSLALGLASHLKTLPPHFADFAFPSGIDFVTAFFLLVIPQIPLTMGNSIVAPPDVARTYFGTKAERVTPRALSFSLGIANIISGLMGGLPVCHGAGGITAHYQFGARTGGATIMIGILFILMSIISSSAFFSFLYLLPACILGTLLMYTGLEHSMLIRDLSSNRESMLIAMLVGMFTILAGSLFIGFAIGVAFGFLFKIPFLRSIVADNNSLALISGDSPTISI